MNLPAILRFTYPAADPATDYRIELRDGQYVIAYWDTATLGEQPTAEYLAQQDLPATNAATWAAQSAARKDREAKVALALPDSDDPVILRRKLNAALHIIQR